jgi:ribosomal protein S12 methylthiotransferase
VEGASANKLEGQVPADIKQQRFERFMELQSQISADKLSQMVGKELTVLVDEVEDNTILARSYADAPEIDGLVVIENDNTSGEIHPGDFVDVKVINSDAHDLYAELLTR